LAAAETDTQFTIFDSSALKKQHLIFFFRPAASAEEAARLIGG
jgi:hypothetical protein